MKRKTVLVVGILVAAALLIVLLLVTHASESDKYSVNENGETFGSIESAFVESDAGRVLDESLFPDLILVENRDGLVGYVRREDFIIDYPVSPEDAERVNEEARQPIPMYESDGITVIGSFPE